MAVIIMSEKIPQFDFSKEEDQKKFDTLPEKEREEIVDGEQDEAEKIEEGRKEFVNLLSNGRIKDFAKNKDMFNLLFNLLPEEIVQQAVKEGFVNCLSKGYYVGTLIEIKDKLNLPEEIFQQAAKEGFVYRLSHGLIDLAIEIKEELNMPEEIVQQAAKEGFVNYLSKGCSVGTLIEIKDKFNLPEEFIQSNEVQKAAKEGFVYCLSKGYSVGTLIEIKDKFNLPEEFIQSNEVQKAAKEGFVYRLSKGYSVGTLIEIKDKFNLPEEFIQSNEVQKAAKEGFVYCLSSGRSERATEIKDKFNLPEEFIQSNEVRKAVKERFVHCLLIEEIDDAVKIKDKFNLSEEFIQQAAKEEIIRCLSGSKIDLAIEIKDKLNLPEAIVQQAVKEGFVNCLSSGRSDSSIEIKDKFNLPEEFIQSNEVQKAAKEGFVYRLSGGRSDLAIKIKEEFNMPEEIVQKAAKEEFIKRLSEGDINDAIKIKEEFSINIQPKEIIEKIPAIKEFLEKIKPVSLQFYEQAQRSTDLVMELFDFVNNQDTFFTTIEENPFLVDAVMENTRFGSKLLLKFPQLDELSQQNIEFLFETKKEILKENPDIEPESLEFRQLMQEKLKNYEDNQDILEEMKRNGININKWLNYEETSHFSLESGKSNLAFSETIATPINRIKETIGSYVHQIKETLKEYKKELLEYQIPAEDTKDIEDKITQMREEKEKAETEGNEKKAQGIQKGIDGLTQKLTDIKTVSSWDKILGDINSFNQLKDGVFGAQEKLIQAENEFAQKSSGKTLSGKEIQEAKQKIANAKEELRNKFGLLENRMENFKTNMPTSIKPALGKERTESLIQEIETSLAEQFDHYDTDRSSLANLFSEKGDKEKDKMDSQPMSIFVWARNPDIDLYQGNYSDCCIKINSEHMGAESTIADYNTDLGVQIINVWDETKNEPVTAAWCWLGRSGAGNEPVLMVDNIESNTVYSSNYPEQLKEELFDYLKNYAKAIGVNKVVLGKANNDLPTAGELARLIDDKNKYEKIGGYNRADGYFLEAEDSSVKIIWEAEKKTVKKEKSKQEAPKTKFKNIDIKTLTKNDFETIKKIERKVYEGTDLVQGQAMIQDIKEGKGLDYSVVLYGKNPKTNNTEAIGYIVATEDETDEGDESIYLEDIAILPEAQGQGLGWEIFQSFIEKLKDKVKRENKPILLDMHLRENSQRFMEKHRQELEQIGMNLIEEALVADYYDEGEDALYQVYEVR